MNSVEFSRAMSSNARVEILNHLARHPLTVAEIAAKLKLKAITVRHHLDVLLRARLIEVTEEARTKVGRPTHVYRIVEQPSSVEFPQRHYHQLSRVLVKAFVDAVGPAGAKKALMKMGEDLGRRIAAEATEKYGAKKWDMPSFKKYIVEEHLSETGALPEVLKADRKQVRFRMHNCVFCEVAKDYPNLICEGLDEGLMRALIKKTLVNAEVKTTKCVGHGDPYCEHTIRMK